MKEISRSDAGATNLTDTSEAIGRIVEDAKQRHRKAICFVTGVPGAGKTLAGLNIAVQRRQTHEDENAVFLSGNGPLVTLLREALARNASAGAKRSLREARRETSAFIQNVHHFRDDAINHAGAPTEQVVIFDEAQRAWTLAETESFMKRKKGLVNFGMSEPEFLIEVMDRHLDWAVIVCLIGGGQEINRGEAGLPAWFGALRERFRTWDVHVSTQLEGIEYLGDRRLPDLIDSARVTHEPALHLAVSIRSFRSERVADFVKFLLERDMEACKQLYYEISHLYPIVLTRNVQAARVWLRNQGRGTERYGLLASSGAVRLRAIGIDVKSPCEVVPWFLNPKDDVRSSYYMEAVATQFDIQGLELDWTGVVWDADLRSVANGWQYMSFKGSKWQSVNDPTQRQYLKNTYRVLLTRARQGMVIVVPEGNPDDGTRHPDFYDRTFEYLSSLGIRQLD